MPKKINWKKIREEYISGTDSLKTIAEKHNISLQAVKQRSAKEKWAAEKKKAKKDFETKVAEERRKINDAKAENAADTLTLIDQIARNMLKTMNNCICFVDKASAAAMYAAALKDLTAVIRDVNYLPNQKDKNAYDIAMQKLNIERDKLSNKTTDENETGVLELPPVMEHE